MASARSGSPSDPADVAVLASVSDPIGAGSGRRRRFLMGGIWEFIIRRLLLGLLVLWLVSLVVFAATQALPGDPARAILGRTATPASLAALREQLNLNQPVIDQYWNWVTGLFHLDAGTSLAAREPVTTLIKDRIV